jgi:TATA-box binding protein (TBP) (component of TFIID and TFIIIB)
MTTQLSSKQLLFPKFDDIKVSTKTYTANTNLIIDIHGLFNLLEVTPYIVLKKKRGRKKKGTVEDPNQDVPYGSIVTLKCEGVLKGVELKPKKNVKSWFRNSITVVMILDKPINFKVCRNGTFQMTGCKSWEHAEMCIRKIWDSIKDTDSVYSFSREPGHLSSLIIPSMRNIDFDIGFKVNREKLSNYINTKEDLYCLLETSFGYTGVNIKIPLTKSRDTMSIQKLECADDGTWSNVWTTYTEYLGILDEKTRKAKIKEQRYNTFLVFHSGKVIFSGITSDYMRDTYYTFTEIIQKSFDSIEERLEK